MVEAVAVMPKGRPFGPAVPYVMGTYHFDRHPGLVVDAKLARDAAELPVQVGEIRGVVCLPELRPGAFGRPRLVTPPLIRRTATVGWLDGRGPSTRWGWSLSDRWNEAQQVYVHMLAMWFPVHDARLETARQVADALFETIGEWSKRLEDWLDVALNEIRYKTPGPPYLLEPRQVVDGLELEYVDEANTVSRLLGPPSPGSVEFLPNTPLTTEAWRHIVDHLNTGREPPNERILLRDARIQLKMDHSRMAVLDAATAAELALTRMLDEILSRLPPEVGEVIRPVARQLGPLAKTLLRLGVGLPASLQQDLVDVRNRVIHAGYEPSRDMAERIFQLARDLVEQALPLDLVLAVDDPNS